MAGQAPTTPGGRTSAPRGSRPPVLPAPHAPGPRAAAARGQKPRTGGPTVTLATATRSAIRPRSATKPPRPEITATRSGGQGATTPRRRSSRPIPGGQLPPVHGGAHRTVITAVGAPETAGAGAGALPLHTTASLPFHTTRIPQHPRRPTISPRVHCTPRISHRVNSPPGRSRPPTSGPADIPRPRQPRRKLLQPGIVRRATPMTFPPSRRPRTSAPVSCPPRTSVPVRSRPRSSAPVSSPPRTWALVSSPLRISPPGKRPQSAAAAGPRRRRPAQARTAPTHGAGRPRDLRDRAPPRDARVSSGSATTMTGPAWTGTSSPTSSTGSSCLPTSRWPRRPAARSQRASPSPHPPGTDSRGPRLPGPGRPRPRPGPRRQWRPGPSRQRLGTPGPAARPTGTHVPPHAKRQPSRAKLRPGARRSPGHTRRPPGTRPPPCHAMQQPGHAMQQPGAKRLPSHVRRQRSGCRPVPGNSRRRRGTGTAHRCRSGPTPLSRRPRASPA